MLRFEFQIYVLLLFRKLGFLKNFASSFYVWDVKKLFEDSYKLFSLETSKSAIANSLGCKKSYWTTCKTYGWKLINITFKLCTKLF